MKKILSILLAATMVISLAACGSSGNNETPETSAPPADDTAKAAETPDEAADEAEKVTGSGGHIGIAMPTQSSERWINDANNLKLQLEALGYTVDVQFAEDDPQEQVAQLENLITNGANCLVVAAVDSATLVNVLEDAKSQGIPVIAYDRLLMDTDAVDYYVTFDNKGVGTVIAEYIVEAKDLEAAREAGDSYTIEFFMGSPDDNNALFLYNGIMEVLQEYLDDGTLVCKTGRTSFEDTCILRWSQETAQDWCENYLSGYYADEKLNIACTAFDGFSYGVRSALEGAGYTLGEDWPLVTGQDAELMATKNIISGYQTMSIYKDTRLLAEKCVTMVQAVLEGTDPEINDTEQYNNNVVTVPTYLCEPLAVDASNYQELLIDSGYYSEADVAE